MDGSFSDQAFLCHLFQPPLLMAFFRQLQLLLWKNWLTIIRQPVSDSQGTAILSSCFQFYYQLPGKDCGESMTYITAPLDNSIFHQKYHFGKAIITDCMLLFFLFQLWSLTLIIWPLIIFIIIAVTRTHFPPILKDTCKC